MRKIYIILLVAICFYSCEEEDTTEKYGGENTFIKFYGYNADNIGVKTLQTSDGGYLILGTSIFAEREKGNIFLAKTNAAGNELWSDTFSISPYYNEAKDIQIADDGGYIILSNSSKYPIYLGALYYDTIAIHLIKVDQQGNLDENFKVDIVPDLEATSFVGSQISKTYNGDYIIIGNQLTESETEVFFLRVNEQGEIIERMYGFSSFSDNLGGDVIEDRDANIIWVGTSANRSSVGRDINVGKFNSIGNIIWNFQFNNQGAQSAKAIIDVGSGFVILGEDQTKDKILLQKISPQGQEIWNRLIGQDNVSTQAGNIVFSQDGGLILVGTIDAGGENKQQIHLIKTNSTAEEILVNNQFGGKGNDIGNHIIETTDNGFLITATIQFENNTMIALIKANSEGYISE